MRADGFKGDIKMLTSCPSCLQGLSRYNDDADMKSDYIVVEMAKYLLGSDWMEKYVQKANSGGIGTCSALTGVRRNFPSMHVFSVK